MMNLALCSFLLVGLVRGFNPAAVVPSQAVTRVQPQTGPTRTNPYVLPDSFSHSGRSFLPPTRPSDPALTATMSEAGAWETTVQGVEETAPRQADGDSWMTLEAGILGSVLGALSVLGARLWRQSSAAPQHRSLFSTTASAPSPGSVEFSRMPGGAEPVYSASPGMAGSLQGPLVAHFADEAGVKSGINGFGRIGRQVARIMIESDDAQLLQINGGSATPDYMAYQYKYDSIHGRVGHEVVVEGDDMILKGKRVKTTRERDPAKIGWDKSGVEYLCESTGVFLTEESAKAHVDAGVKKVIFSAPAKDDSLTVVMGVNADDYKGQTDYVSCASCTTNGLAPLVKCINDKFGIEEGLMTTIHAMTATQAVVDSSSRKDWRGGRAASGNIIPSSTGAAKAVAKVIPQVKGKLTGMAFRVPTIDVSVVDLTCRLKNAASYEDICAEVRRRADGDMKGFLGYTDEDLVSTDFESWPISSTFDAKAGISLNPNFVKLVAWYDNEWGYSCRVKDLMVHMAKVDAAVKK